MNSAQLHNRKEFDPHIARLRGIFAICVALGHSYDVVRLQAPVDFATSVLGAARNFFGISWVVGFIVLSGYCIARSTLSSGRPFSFGPYVVLRVTRIFPLLIACSLITAFVEYIMLGDPNRPQIWTAGIDLMRLGVALLGLSGFYYQFGSYAPSYTVSYELLYYLLWGSVLALVSRAGRALLASFVLALMLYAASLLYGPLPVKLLRSVLTPWVLMLFIVWIAGAAVSVYEDRVRSLVRGTPVSLAWGVWLAFSLTIANNGGHPHYAEASGAAFWSYIGLAACYCLVIVTYLAADKNSDALWFDRWLGEISYPVFLVHGPMIVFTGYLLNRYGIKMPFLPYLGLCLAISLLAAHLLAILVERPVMRWRRRLREISTTAELPPSESASLESL